jgi:hypothetical protein
VARVHLVFYLELFETSRFSANFQVPGWLGAAITAAGYPERSTDSGLGFGGSGAATARRGHGADTVETVLLRIPWRYSTSGGQSAVESEEQRSRRREAQLQHTTDPIHDATPSFAIADVGGVCYGRCGVWPGVWRLTYETPQPSKPCTIRI